MCDQRLKQTPIGAVGAGRNIVDMGMNRFAEKMDRTVTVQELGPTGVIARVLMNAARRTVDRAVTECHHAVGPVAGQR